MDIVSRVKGIVLKPKDEWTTIKGEDTPIATLFTGYAMILAAIPAIAHFIGLGILGRRIPFVGWIRYPMGKAFLYAILSYVFSLASVYLLGFIINALAPTFGSKQNMQNAMKLAVYTWTPAWIAGALNIYTQLAILAFLASLYCIYVLYLGFSEPLMDTPNDKVVTYLIVSIVVAFILMIVASVILGAIFAVSTVSGSGIY
jgi:hypothetical protein